jgi:hypothetical protein
MPLLGIRGPQSSVGSPYVFDVLLNQTSNARQVFYCMRLFQHTERTVNNVCDRESML